MYTNLELSEERLSKLMAERLEAEMSPPPIPQTVEALHEAGFHPAQIAHRTGLNRADVERFVRRLSPVQLKRYERPRLVS